MTVLFEGDVHVHYGFVYVDSGVGGWDQEIDQRAGQRNGLLGAAQPGFLLISTGMHTGLVPFRVEAHPAAPPLEESYGEIVEASCDLRGPEVSLSAFDWLTFITLPEGGPHRVRLSARDYEAGREQERYEAQDPVRDSYLLQLWPAEMADDEIVRATSPSAGYWHELAREHPAAPSSPHEQALAEQRERDDAVAQHHAYERAEHLQRWGGRDPSPRLLQVEQHALPPTYERRELVDAIVALPADRQRALAIDVARWACAEDNGPLDWQPALDALASGHPLPAPFDDPDAVFAALFPGPGTITTGFVTSSSSVWPPPRVPLHTGVTADAAVRAAAAVDPLEAALRAVNAASWSVPDLEGYFSRVARLVARG